MEGHARRLGRPKELAKLSDGGRGRVYFATLKGWYNRRRLLPRRIQPGHHLVVVWDECHWAQDATTGRALLDAYLSRSLVYGLTATPLPPAQDRTRVVWSTQFAELIGVRLAQPLRREVGTDYEWDPVLSRQGDFAQRSLAELGQAGDRNRLIVEELLRGRALGEYRKTVVFACDVAHAVTLATALGRAGVPALALHSGQPAAEQVETMAKFRETRIDVLVNVLQLAEGADIPDVDTVLLARPTTSRTLYTQMVGRAARLAPGKTTFRIVEFVDTLSRFGSEVFRGTEFCTPPAIGGGRGGRPVGHHSPEGEPQFTHLPLPGGGRASFVRGQTFGVEIELTAKSGVPECCEEWVAGARRLIEALGSCVNVHPDPLEYHGDRAIGDPTRWYVTRDSSAGWELVSPILADETGFAELERVSTALNPLCGSGQRFRVNHRTGLHLTLATRLTTLENLKGFVKRLQRLEPGLYTLVAPSRLYAFDGRDYDRDGRNGYCRPVREEWADVDMAGDDAFMARSGERYRSVNLAKAQGALELLEVRMHHGTVEYAKIALWTCLWMHLFHHARYRWEGRSAYGEVFPGGDVQLDSEGIAREDLLKLLAVEGIVLDHPFQHALALRRRELLPRWAALLPQRVSSWRAAGW